MSTTPVKKVTWRMGAKERFRIQAVVIAIICVLMYLGLKPYYDTMVDHRLYITCQDNVKKLAQGFSNYMNDWDDTTPVADHWLESISGNMGVTSGTGFDITRYYHCPTDKTGGPSSYVYNDLLAGLSPTVKQGKKQDVRLLTIGRFDRAPLLLEKHGAKMNDHVTVSNWDDLAKHLTLSHPLPDMSGSLIFGDRHPGFISKEKLQDHAGKRF